MTRSIIGLAMGLVLGWLVPSSALAQSAAPASPALVKVRFGVVTTASQAAFIVGVQKGIFRRHGFDVEVFPLTTGAQANQALAANQVDWSGGGLESTVVGWATNLPFKAYAMYAKGGDSYGILVRTDAGIRTPADLRGKTVAVPQGTAPAAGLNQVLKAANLPPNAVRRVNVNYGNMGSMLIQGSVDAMVGLEPFLSITQEKMGDKSALLMRLGSVVQGGGMFLIGDAWADAHPDRVDKAVAALWEAEQAVRKDPAGAAAIAAAFLKVDPTSITTAFKWLKYDPIVDQFTRDSLKRTADYLTEEHLIPDTVEIPAHLQALDRVTATLRAESPGLLE